MNPSRGICAGITVALLAFAAGCQDPAPKVAHNVLLISFDTLRADHLGTYGYERDTSPHLDARSEDGIVFEMAIAQAASTFPSHMSLFQSRYASQVEGEAPMLAEILQRAGYRTGAFTGGGNVSAQLGFGRGFDVYREARHPARLAETLPLFESWLRATPSEPFFAFLHAYDIHHPYDPPAPFDSAFSPDYTGPITGRSTGPLLNKLRRIHQFSDFDGEVSLTDDDRQRVRALYDGGILHADTLFGEIAQLLDELALWERTIVVFLSDHGEEFWEHGQVLHSFTVYQELVHVPLILWIPGQSASRVSQQVRLMDVVPTVLDVLGLKPPRTVQGRSLLPVAAGTESAPPAISEMDYLKAWIDPPHKLIVDIDAQGLQRFDLSRDPGEQLDLTPEGRDASVTLYRELAQALGDSVAQPVSGSPKELPADPQLIEQLRALGYLE
ncbi:MAG: sulfatase [Acidobacteriota bacterium]